MRAVTLPHFPHPCLAVLWRNWNRVPVARLARVLQAPEAELKEAASLMGLDGGACDSNAETEDGSKTVEIPPDKTWTALNEPFGKSVRSIRVKGAVGTVLQIKSVEV